MDGKMVRLDPLFFHYCRALLQRLDGSVGDALADQHILQGRWITLSICTLSLSIRVELLLF